MGGNIGKAPLVGLFYAALMWLAAALLPWSETYRQAAADFTMPMMGFLMMFVLGLLAAIVYAVVFSGANGGGVALVAMLFLSACGTQWLAPMLRQLLLGETTGTLSNGDTLFQFLGGAAITLLTLVLSMLLYRVPAPPEGKAPQPEPKYKVRVLGLVIRLIVLPVIYFVLYHLLWYFLFWRNEAARQYHGVEALDNFMGVIIDILINHGFQAVVTLLTGLAYALFSLPILLRMRHNRVLYIVSVVLLYLSGAVCYLIPNPVMPDAVRMAHLIETAAILAVYGVLSGLLLYTAFRREEVPAPAVKPDVKAPAKEKRPAAVAKPAAKAAADK